jgi:NAD(P)-dependent dehydrogenase (short-subunit alcohol dehydrogenase family)
MDKVNRCSGFLMKLLGKTDKNCPNLTRFAIFPGIYYILTLTTKGKAMKTFNQKVAVITGAGSGLGRALALQLHQDGAHLALCDLDMPGLEETLRMSGEQAGRISLHRVDVTNREEMHQFAREVLSRHHQADILINNAGISLTPTPFDGIPDELFEKVIAVNLWGVYNGTRAFLSHLRTRPEASLVNISSLAGLVGVYGYSPYAMSKFAVRGLSETLQSELVGTKVSVLVVHPGGVKTNIIRNAPDLDASQRDAAHQTFSRLALLDADQAARQILRAMRQKKKRLILGADAKVVNAIRQLFPGNFPIILHAIFSKATFK